LQVGLDQLDELANVLVLHRLALGVEIECKESQTKTRESLSLLGVSIGKHELGALEIDQAYSGLSSVNLDLLFKVSSRVWQLTRYKHTNVHTDAGAVRYQCAQHYYWLASTAAVYIQLHHKGAQEQVAACISS
jgi:hypothetical protein